MINWTLSAVNNIDSNIVRKSFKVCGINLALDGSEDQLLNPKIKL